MINYIEYTPMNTHSILICIHGGNFSGGCYTYDAQQNQALSNLGYHVIQPEFPKKFSEFKIWANEFISQFKKQTLPVHIIGRSSGGYLAKYLYDTYRYVFMRSIYLAPILNPVMRYELLNKFEKGTKKFFDEDPILFNSFSEFELIIIAEKDDNAPLQLYENLTKMITTYDTHYALLTSTDHDFVTFVHQFLCGY